MTPETASVAPISAPTITRGKRMRRMIARAMASPSMNARHDTCVAPMATATAMTAASSANMPIRGRAIERGAREAVSAISPIRR